MLTVVMPVYNNERYVAEAIESVLAQTYRDFELLVCDDGSKDRSLAIARRYEAVDRRVRVVTHPNMGIANTMNEGIGRCRTEWVACMHGDDVMLPHRLERQMAFVKENPDLALVSSLVQWIDQNGQAVGYSRSHLTNRRAVREEIGANGVLAFPHPAALFKKSAVQAVGGYRQSAFPTEDLDLWNRIADAGFGVLVQPEVLLKYRMHADSSSTTRALTVMRYIRWVEACVAARRSGRPEPTVAEFEASRRNAPAWQRLNDCRMDWGHAVYQQALCYYAGRQYHRLAPALLAAVLLRPGVFLPRLLARVKPWMAGRAERAEANDTREFNGAAAGADTDRTMPFPKPQALKEKPPNREIAPAA